MIERRRGPTRRAVLVGTASLLTLAGCQSTGSASEPVSIDDGNCEQCGMAISEHPGPAGQSYYQDNTPSDHEGPALFCSTTCTYRHRFARAEMGWTPAATFLTDYSSVGYEVRTDGGAAVLSRHLDAAAFADSSGLTVVANSGVEGAMGTAIVPFAESEDAEAFVAEYGGTTLAAEDIQRELVNQG
jgi:nitrous oxide reductase accessory protein NosL